MNLIKFIKHFCFDLDGTLINSNKTIYKTTLKTLEELNIGNNLPEDQFNNMIGMHFVDIFLQFNVQVPEFEHFIKIYKKLYFDFISDSTLYEGIQEVLDFLQKNNFKISLLTTKGQDQAEKIIDHFRLKNYFDEIMGRRNGMAHKPSPEPLLSICKNLNIPANKTMMVGDTELDIQCGKNSGAKTCAVAYGYRTKSQLKKESPDFIITQPLDLIKITTEQN